MKDFKLKSSKRDGLAEKTGLTLTRVSLAIAAILFCTALAGVPRLVSHAQRMYVPVKVSNVSSQTSASGSLVTIAADNSLARAQTWQDEEGFHVVLPNTIATDSLKPGRGVKVRRVGSSLEVVAHTRPGTRVSVSSAQNQLSLVIDGKLEGRPAESAVHTASSSHEERSLFEEPNRQKIQKDPAPLRLSSSVDDPGPISRPAATERKASYDAIASLPVYDASLITSSSQAAPSGANTAATAIQVQSEDESVLASIFSGTSVLIISALGIFGLLVSRRIRSRHEPVSKNAAARVSAQDLENAAQLATPNTQGGSKSLVKVGETALSAKSSRQSIARMPVAAPTSLYGAYRIDQEVGKLILGQPHRIDVLASRAVDDRRAIETSLIKGVNSTELDEKSQSRARAALEEYGFVARQCAALLLAPDAYERSSAARALGEIKSPTALPFLLEGLYDSESIVRNQAVMSIGELKLPSAIGALLDIARTHPDVPSSLLSRTLSACSVEGLDFFDAVPAESSSVLGPGDVGNTIREITHLEPSSPVESLPADSDDEKCVQALSLIESGDVSERSEALKTLVQFRVQSAVDAIAKVARHDLEPTVRSLAISSLGSINHESVFATVLIGMADDSREVRAAAARSVSRLSFDRADAYVRVIETSDDETLACVAKACIQAGIVSQNLDRLTYADHRQAYETFSLICLLTKARMNEPVLEAIADHPRMDVRLKAVHLLGRTGHPDTFGQLRELAVKDGIGEVVKTALLEAMYKLDQSRLTQDEILDEPKVEDDLQLEMDHAETVAAYLGPDFESEVASAFEADVFREADELEI